MIAEENRSDRPEAEAQEEAGMIEKLGYDEERIFEVELSKDRASLEITEACDFYYSAKLTKQQVIELAQDFLALAEQMVDSLDDDS